MNAAQFSSALGKVNDKYIMEAITYECKKKSGWLKWGAMAACFGLILTAALVMLPGILKGTGGVVPPPNPDPGPVVSDNEQSNADSPHLVEPGGDTRAETWLTAEELGMATPEGTVSGGLMVPIFISYRGSFYGSVGVDQIDSLRFAPSESENLLFNLYYTHTVYLVENHPSWIAIHINGMEVYEKIFDVTFAVDGTTYAIAYSPVMNADYSLGDVVLETEDYTVYEAVKLQGEPAQTTEYIVDILPLLQRERPNFFDGSDLEPGDSYGEQWQLALPLFQNAPDKGTPPAEYPDTIIVPGFDLDEPGEPDAP